MKLKRFLALAVSLVMVLSIVPAMTVSAATTSAEIPATTDFGWNFTTNATTESADNVNLVVSWNNHREALMSFAIPAEILAYADQDAKITATLTTKAPTYNNGIGSAPIMTIIALDGDVIDSADMNGGANTSAALNEAIAAGTVLGTMDAKASNSVDLDITSMVKSGETNLGLLLTCHGGRGYEQYGIIQFKSPVVTFTAAASTAATVVYTDGTETLWTETVSGLAEGGSYTPAMPGSGVVVNNNVAYDVVSVEGIDALSATASENVATVTLAKKFGIVKNFIENGDFETGDLTGWGANEAPDAWFDVIDGNNGTGNKVLKSTATGWVSHEVCAIGGERSFQKVVTGIEPGKVYYYTADVYTGSNVGLWMNYAFLTSETRMTYGNTANLYVTEGAQTNCTTTACATGTQLSNNYKQQWHTFSGLVTADDVAKAFEFDVYYLHDSPNSLIDNVAFYETDLVPSATTIKYVDAQGAELQTAATVEGYVGDVIDLTDETLVPETITYNGNLYSKAATNATSYAVATAADVVEVVYVTDAVTAVDNTTTATVIGDNAPVLPAAIKATTGTGAETTVNVEWSVPSELAVGENTVYGTVEGSSLQAEATVTVLEEAFSIADVTTVNGQDAGKAEQKLFPVAISDEFAIEFTANYASFGDLWITIKTAGAGFFGPEQIPLGVNASGAFRPVNGNGNGGRAADDFDHVALTTGVNYRFFVTTDASTGKYSVTVTNEATGEVVDAFENYGYRTNANAIEAITSLTNNGAGSVTLTNIKVASDTVSALKQEYTVVTTVNGVTESTETVKALSADEITAEEREGYQLTKSVDGNTVTFAYISVIDVTITYTVNGETIKTETKQYDPLVADGAAFDAVTYYANGVNAIYEAAAATYAESQSVALTALANSGTLTVGDTFVGNDGISYEVKSANLIPNGDFSLGLTGWYGANNGDLTTSNFTVNGDGTVTSKESKGTNDAGSLHRAWAIEDGKTYVFVQDNDTANEYHKFSITNVICSEETADATLIITTGNATGTSQTIFTNNGYAYAQIKYRWTTATFGNFGLYEIAPVLCTVTVDGEAKQVVKGGSYSQALAGAALVDAEGNIYAPVDGVVTVPVNGDMVLTTKALGLEMISGAQVRIGATELAEGDKLDALADSGLRFLATADYTDTLLADADEFGIKVTAEASDKVIYVPAEKFQDADETVFSAAITNLAESNYNRKYTAVAYAKIGDVEITTGEVTRSVYQVSAGIMKNGTADAENEEYTVSGVVKNILNAYVNQTGIRLSVSADGVAVEEGKYTGDVFFTVESVSDGDDGWNVTITPDSSWGTPAEIAEWWTDYVRFNNNNSVAKGYISDAAVEDGVLTFNFDTTADAE